MKIAYVLLAHQHPVIVSRLIKRLVSNGSYVSLHYDVNGGDSDFDHIKELLSTCSDRVFYAERVRVGWGEWSITQATLNCLNKLKETGEFFDYIHLISGADYPIRKEADFKSFLSRNKGFEYIQAVDISNSKWVVGGLTHERYQYRHYFNFQKNKKLFDIGYNFQKKFFKKREFPKGFKPHMGSQWWTLTWSTCLGILKLSEDNDLTEFFRSVWIPDEMYIQTLVAKLVDPCFIAGKCLTLYQFKHNGIPLVFCNDHLPYLARQPFFFARKISPFATELRNGLDSFEVSTKNDFSIFSDDQIGVLTDEYNEFFKVNASKSNKGKRIVGFVEDPWYGDLKTNDKPYFVITGVSNIELRMIKDYINNLPGFVCHGELFNPSYIEFKDCEDSCYGISKNDIRIRDHSPVNFLAQILRSSNDVNVAFLFPYGQSDNMLERFIWDKNANIVHLHASPGLLYKENGFLNPDSRFLGAGSSLSNNEFIKNILIEKVWSIEHKFYKCGKDVLKLRLYDMSYSWSKKLALALYENSKNTVVPLDFIDSLPGREFEAAYLRHHLVFCDKKYDITGVFSEYSEELGILRHFVGELRSMELIQDSIGVRGSVINGLARTEIVVISPTAIDLMRAKLVVDKLIGGDYTFGEFDLDIVDIKDALRGQRVLFLKISCFDSIFDLIKFDSKFILYVPNMYSSVDFVDCEIDVASGFSFADRYLVLRDSIVLFEKIRNFFESVGKKVFVFNSITDFEMGGVIYANY